MLDLAGNDYLGPHPRPTRGRRRRVDALQTWGAGSTGSRLVTGTTAAARASWSTSSPTFCGAEAGLVFSSGYAANLGVRDGAVRAGHA